MCCDLPDSKDDTEEDAGVGKGFQEAAAFFLRANEERVGGFLVVSHKSFVWLFFSLMQPPCQANYLRCKSLKANRLEIIDSLIACGKCSAPGNRPFRFWDAVFW